MMKEIPGYPLQYVTTDGFIYSMRTGEMRQKPMRMHNGYYRVNLRDNGCPVRTHPIPVHKIVLDTFVGPRPAGYVCRHLNGDPLDNRLGNLCWGTPKENAQDAMRHGTAVCLRHGENAIAAKLSNEDVRELRKRYEEGQSRSELARFYNISWRHASDIVSMKTRKCG